MNSFKVSDDESCVCVLEYITTQPRCEFSALFSLGVTEITTIPCKGRQLKSGSLEPSGARLQVSVALCGEFVLLPPLDVQEERHPLASRSHPKVGVAPSERCGHHTHHRAARWIAHAGQRHTTCSRRVGRGGPVLRLGGDDETSWLQSGTWR